jgi:hypothetical protein
LPPSLVGSARPTAKAMGTGAALSPALPPKAAPTSLSGEAIAFTIAARSACDATVMTFTLLPRSSPATGMSNAMRPCRSRSSASATSMGMPNCCLKSESPSLPPRSKRSSLSAVVESYAFPFNVALLVRESAPPEML